MPVVKKIIRLIIIQLKSAQFRKYIIIGITSVLIDFLILYCLTDLIGLYYLLSKTISYFIVFWYSFLLNKFWAFKSNKYFIRHLVLYSFLVIINYIIASGLMYLLTDIFSFYYLVSNLFVIGFITVWNFAIYKKVIYKN